jgi:transcriptional regulator with XRE-family HTH domain
MTARERAKVRGRRVALQALADLGRELREQRLTAGVSQAEVGARLSTSRWHVARYESGRYAAATIVGAAELLSAVGLGLRLSTYPLGDGPRDARHAAGVLALVARVGTPLTWRTEVPLPNPRDARAWDAVITGRGQRTGVEYERVLRDIQAQARRLALKRRDGGVDYLIVLVAGTRANRATLRANPAFMPELPRRSWSFVADALARGEHPGDALVLA